MEIKLKTGIGMLIMTYLVIIISISHMATAQSEQNATETIGDFMVSWQLTEDKSNYKSYMLNITNIDVINDNFDLQILQQGSKAKVMLSEYRNISYNYWVYDLDCDSRTETINGTQYGLGNCTDNGYNVVRSKMDYETLQHTSYFSDSEAFKYLYGDLYIRDGESRIFKVELTDFTSIQYTVNLSAKDGYTGNIYHPIITSTRYESNFNTDIINGTCWIGADGIVGTEITNFTTDAFTYHNLNNEFHTGGLTGGTSGDFTGNYPLKYNDSAPDSQFHPLFNNETCISSELKECVQYRNVEDNPNTLYNLSVTHTFINWTIAFWFNATDWTDDCNNGVGPQWNSFYAMHSGNGGFGSQGDKAMIMRYANVSNFLSCIVVPSDGASGGSSFYSDWQPADNKINISQKNFFACIKDGNDLTVWYNDKNRSTLTASIPNMAFTNGFLDVGAGNYWGGGLRNTNGRQCSGINGLLDDFQIYDRALTNAEMVELYNNGLGKEPAKNSCVMQSATFNTGQNDTTFRPLYACKPTLASCVINVTMESVLYANVTNNENITLVPPTTDGNTTFNYTIELNSNISSFNITFNDTVNLTPSAPNLTFPLNNTNVTVGNITFTWQNSTDPDNDTITYFFTLFKNGTNILGNTTTTNITVDMTNISIFPFTNYSWQVNASDLTTFNVSQLFVFNLINITPPPVPPNVTNEYVCVVFSNACEDGKIKCLLAINNATGEEITSRDAFDKNCVGIKTVNPFIIFIILFLIIALIVIGYTFNVTVLRIVAGFIGIVLGFMVIQTWFWFGVTMMFIWGLYTLVETFEILK